MPSGDVGREVPGCRGHRAGAGQAERALAGSLYEAFEPAEAERLADRFELHYTPEHGSWLDMAEIALGTLSQQCQPRRIDNIDALRRETHALKLARDADDTNMNWHFTTADARIKLR